MFHTFFWSAVRIQVKTMGPEEAFGELALMYSTPRTATCKALSKARLWALDRISFKVRVLHRTAWVWFCQLHRNRRATTA